MPHTHRSVQRSLFAIALCTVTSFTAVALLPAVADGAPTSATVRIEGASSTILGETQVTTDTRTLSTEPSPNPFCSGNGSPVTVNGPTAIGVLADAATVGSFTYGISNQYGFGLLVCRIASESGALDGSTYWLYKVNHKAPPVGADQYPLASGDRVLWYLATPSITSTLDIATPLKVAVGSTMAVDVTAYDDNGSGTPASGAQVSVGSKSTTTGASGRAELTLDEPGTFQVRAERSPSSVRSPAYTICAYKPEDGDCQSPVSATSGPAAAHIDKPVDGRIYGSLKAVSGTVSGGGQNVSVRIRVKRIAYLRCTAWRPSKARFARVAGRRGLRKSSCSDARYFDVPVDSSGAWSYSFPKPLKPGVYALNARAAGPGDSVESAVKDGVNRVRFAIRHRKRGK